MDISDLNIYDDLDEFQEKEEKKSSELLVLEEKNKELLNTIEQMKKETKALGKKVDIMHLNFKILLETAKTEIKRKDLRIAELQREKDDICFRRKNVRNKETNQSWNEHRQLSAYPHLKALEEASTSKAAYARPVENEEETAVAFNDADVYYPKAEYVHRPVHLQKLHLEERDIEVATTSSAVIPPSTEHLEEKPSNPFKRQHSPRLQLDTTTSQKHLDYKLQSHQTYLENHTIKARPDGEAEIVSRPSRDHNRDPCSNRRYTNHRHNNNVEDQKSVDRAIVHDNHKDVSNNRYRAKHKWLRSDAEDGECDDTAIGYDAHKYASNNRYLAKHKWIRNDGEDGEWDDTAIAYDSHKDASNNRYLAKHKWNSDVEDGECDDTEIGYDNHKHANKNRYYRTNLKWIQNDAKEGECDDPAIGYDNYRNASNNRYRAKHIWNSDVEDGECDDTAIGYDNHKDPSNNRYYRAKHKWNADDRGCDDRAIGCDKHKDASNDRYRTTNKWNNDTEDHESDEKKPRDRNFEGHKDIHGNRYKYKHRRHTEAAECKEDDYRSDRKEDDNRSDRKDDDYRSRDNNDHGSIDRGSNDHYRRDRSRGRNHNDRSKDHDSRRSGHSNENTEYGKYSKSVGKDMRPHKHHRKESSSESLKDSYKNYEKRDAASKNEKEIQTKYTAEDAPENDVGIKKKEEKKEIYPQENIRKSDLSADVQRRTKNRHVESSSLNKNSLASKSQSDESSIRITQKESICGKDAIKQADNNFTTKDVHLKNEEAKDKRNVPLNVENTTIRNAASKTELRNEPANSNIKLNKETILNTPKKKALFDALFGSSPCIKEKDNSGQILSENITNIINCDSSASTSPDAYSDANEMQGEEAKPCDGTRSQEAKAYNNNNNKYKTGRTASSAVDAEETKTSSESICDPQKITKTNNPCLEVDEKLRVEEKLKEKSKPIDEQLILQKLNNSEVIEIDDDSSSESAGNEIVFERVSSEVVEKPQQQPRQCEKNIPRLEKTNENNQTKRTVIEIIEDIRLPTVLPIKQILKTGTENNTEVSEIASEIAKEIYILSNNNVDEDNDVGEECVGSKKLSSVANGNGDDVVTKTMSNNETVFKNMTNIEDIPMITLDDDANFDENISSALNSLKKIIEFELDKDIVMGVDSSEINVGNKTIAVDDENKQLIVDDNQNVNTTEGNSSNEVAEKTTETKIITTSVDADDDKQKLIEMNKSRLKKKIHKETHRDEKNLEKVFSDDREEAIQVAAAAEKQRPSENVFHVDKKIQNEKFNDNDIESSNIHEDTSKEVTKKASEFDASKSEGSAAESEYKMDHIYSPDKNQDHEISRINDDLISFAVTVKSAEEDEIANRKYDMITNNKNNSVNITGKVDGDVFENSSEELLETNNSLEKSISSSVEASLEERAEEEAVNVPGNTQLNPDEKQSTSDSKRVAKEQSSKEKSTIDNTTKKEEIMKEIKDTSIIIQQTNTESSGKDHEGEKAGRDRTRKEKEINCKEDEEKNPNQLQSKKETERKKKPEKEPNSEELDAGVELLNKPDKEIIKTSQYSNKMELKTWEKNVDVCNKTTILCSNELFVDKLKDNNKHMSHDKDNQRDDHKSMSSRIKLKDIKGDTNKVQSKSFDNEKNNEIKGTVENKSKENTNVDGMVKHTQDSVNTNSKNNILEEKTVETKQFDEPLNSSTSDSLRKTENLEDQKETRENEKIEQNGPEVEWRKNSKVNEVTSKSRTVKRRLSDEDRTTTKPMKFQKIDNFEKNNENHEHLTSEKSKNDSDNEMRIIKRRNERTTTKTKEVNETKEISTSSVPKTTRNRNITTKAKQKIETILRAKDVLQEQLEFVEKPPEKIPEEPEKKITETLSPENSHKKVHFDHHADSLTGSASRGRQKSLRRNSKSPSVTRTVTNTTSKAKKRNTKCRRIVDLSSSDDEVENQTKQTFLNIFRNNAVEAKQATRQTNLSPPPPPSRSSEPQRNKETTTKKVSQVATSNNSIVSAARMLGSTNEGPRATAKRTATIRTPTTPDHAIFHIEPTNLPTTTELPSFNTPQDKQYKDIDSRLQSMFQSPTHVDGHLTAVSNIMYSPTHEDAINSEPERVSNNSPSPAVVVTPPAIVTTNTSPSIPQPINDLSTVTFDDSLNADSILAEQQLNASLLNTIKSEENCFETKRLSLGNSEYRIEKISANVSKVFIKRKRHKKKINTTE